MADFCTVCAEEMGFPEADIPVYELHASLDLGMCIGVLCEGCGLRGIANSENGDLEVAYSDYSPEDENEPVKWLGDYEKNSLKRFNNSEI